MKEYEIGYIISQEEYPDVASYCNEKGDRTITLVDGKYVVTEIVISDEEIAATKRGERDSKLNSVTWRLERFQEQKQLGIDPDDSEDTYKQLLEYRQYLRNIPESEGFPYVDVLSFDEWVKANDPDYVPTLEELLTEGTIILDGEAPEGAIDDGDNDLVTEG